MGFLGLAITQMRHSARSLLAVSLATLLGVAFVAATLVTGNVLEGTFANALSWQYKGASVIITPDGSAGLDPALVDRVRTVPGVETAGNRAVGVGVAAFKARETYPLVVSLPQAPAMQDALSLADGRLPAANGEVALVRGVADVLGVSVGDTIEFFPPSGRNGGQAPVSLTVVGIVTAPSSLSGVSPDMFVPVDANVIAQLNARVDSILVVASPGTSAADLAARLNADVGDGVTARTFSQQADQMAKKVSGDVEVLGVGLLAFAVIALFVASIVISNTFTVLVTQRTRNLALLRCVGATRSQVRRSVLFEAAVIGVVASILGIALGIGGLWAVLHLYAGAVGNVTLVTDLALQPSDLIVPFMLGLGVTMVAAWAPASVATRVAPLAALRPQPVGDGKSAASRLRIALAGVLVIGGAGMLLAGVAIAFQAPGFLPIGVGVLGGIVSFVGVMVGGVVIVPRVVGLMGRLASPFGAPAAIAAANSVRNPKRTTATALALLVAVTLVTMMSVGAASSKSTLNAAIEARDPVDLVIMTDADVPLPERVVQTASGNPEVARTMPVTVAQVSVAGVDSTVLGVDAELARAISDAPDQLAPLAPGVAIVPAGIAEERGIVDGQTLPIAGRSGDISLQARVTDLRGPDIIVTSQDLTTIAPGATVQRLWVQFRDGVDGGQATGRLQDALAGSGQLWYQGGAAAKAQTARVLDTLLLIVTLLLGVAVVIALVGVGNTLSLSVLERTRESAILRAMGLTRGQMRRMLALEGTLIALVGAAIGIVLGILYGVAGTLTLFGDMFGVSLAVPWFRIVMIVLIGLLSGVLASVLPARSALKVSPVAALAE
ncbi:MAG: FtsX-like permease family protein [Thermomicrobiales bacterium]